VEGVGGRVRCTNLENGVLNSRGHTNEKMLALLFAVYGDRVFFES